MITTVKCQCGHRSCKTYGLSIGTFYQGCGFDKETAEKLALAYNTHDRFIKALRNAVRWAEHCEVHTQPPLKASARKDAKQLNALLKELGK